MKEEEEEVLLPGTAQSCCLESSFEAMGVPDFVSCGGGVGVAAFEGGRVDSSAVSVSRRQKVIWKHSCDVARNSLVKICESLLLPALLQWWQVQLDDDDDVELNVLECRLT